ncbi:hypothetical protein OEA41_004455 [Lepraria neglecta]|uniref:Uncharacterized protein n=1 Tax=Lepraria neglecta TaxID=209136 RepID=A0AAE0DFW3_9LECA|nr:hypothetical protein OEA41_004455 [Lepraria neglecta]
MSILYASENAPRRLSKPRTNTSSSNLLSTFSDQQTDPSSSPLHSSDHDYFGENATVVNSQGERRSRRKSRSKIRAYLYGSNEEAIQNSSEEEDGRNGLSGTARNVRKRMSRTSSSIMQLQSAKASSAYLSKSESQGSDPEESAIVAHQIKERAYHDSLAAKNHVTSPIDEDKHPDSVMAPVRRKSLYTPGIATRNASDILRKPPQPDSNLSQVDRDYYFNPDRPESSPLAQLAKLNLVEDGRATPSSIHNFPQLGGLQLGTLRVTNGIPRNDTPDFICRSATPNSKTQEEYHTASEGSLTGNLSSVFPCTSRSPLQTEGEIQPSFQSEDEDNVTPRESLDPRKAMRDPAANIADEYMAELEGRPFSYSETPMSKGNANEDDSLDDEGIFINQAEGPAADMWRQFIDGAAAHQGGSHTREDAFRKLNGNTPSIYESQRLSVPSSMTSRYSVSTEVPKTDSGYGSNSSLYASHRIATNNGQEVKFHETEPVRMLSRSSGLSGPREMPEPISKQGDYNSQPVGPAPIPYSFHVMPRHDVQRSTPNLSTSPSSPTVNTVRPSARSVRSSSQTLARKLQKPRLKSQPPPVNSITVQGYRDLEQASIPRVPSVIAARHADRLRQFPLLDHTFPSSQHTTADENSSSTEVRPMPVRFPSPANALEAATANLYAAPVNTDETRNSRHRRSLKHRKSTIVDGNEWTHSDIVRSPSWSDFGGGRKKREQKRQAKAEREAEERLLREERELTKRLEKDRKDLDSQIRKDGEKLRGDQSRSGSRTREPSQYDTLVTIADFGTVAESLGGNPYDIATSMFSSASPTASNKHPHQISNAMSRPKSMVGMDEMAAAELGRARSRARSQSIGRLSPSTEGFSSGGGSISGKRLRPHSMLGNNQPPVPALAAVDLLSHNLEWARSRQRSGSFYDRGGIPVLDAPPVPALPTIQQVEQREAQITKSRPRSMIVGATPVQASLQRIDNQEIPNDGSSLSRPSKSTSPSIIRAKKLVPDLWSNGSLEKKGPKATTRLRPEASSNNIPSSTDEEQLGKDNIWEAQRQAWSQRRKSAGEALLRNQKSAMFDNRTRSFNSRSMQQQNDRPSLTASAYTSGPQDLNRPKRSSRPSPIPLAPLPNPLASHPQISPQQRLYELEYTSSPYSSNEDVSYHRPAPQQTFRPGPSPLTGQPQPQSQLQPQLPTPARPRAQPQPFTITRKRVGSGSGSGSGSSTPTSAFESLTGRYAGGLMYGYEPGCGLGGSAGTRSVKTEASRKSVDVSKGFGVDLSDVPIFVAPTPTK